MFCFCAATFAFASMNSANRLLLAACAGVMAFSAGVIAWIGTMKRSKSD